MDFNDTERVAELTARLGLPELSLPVPLALEALRHGSYVHERKLVGEVLRSNERMEFLGDAALGLAISRRCCELFPDFPEGALTRLRAAFVNEDALAGVARSLNLGELLLLGRGEERTGGRDKQSLLADALEAVMAAVYLGCGPERTAEVVDRLWAKLFDDAAKGVLGRDYKTELQEAVQAAHRAAPQYRVVDAPGPQHARTFEVEVSLLGQRLGRGSGRSKKEAEQAAAKEALLSPLPPPPTPTAAPDAAPAPNSAAAPDAAPAPHAAPAPNAAPHVAVASDAASAQGSGESPGS